MLKYIGKGLNIIGACITGYVVLKIVYDIGVENGKRTGTAQAVMNDTVVDDDCPVGNLFGDLEKGKFYEIEKNGKKVRFQVL